MKNQAILNKKYAPSLVATLLIQDEKLSALSSDAKLIYLSLYSQFVCNAGSLDSKGQQYLIYTRKEMEALINKSDKPVAKAVKSLVDAGLIMEFKRGKGLPNIIYLCQISDSIASLEAQLTQNLSTEESTDLSTDLPVSADRVGEMPIQDGELTESESDTYPTPNIYNTNNTKLSFKTYKSKYKKSIKTNKNNLNNKDKKRVVVGTSSLSATKSKFNNSSNFQDLILDQIIYKTYVDFLNHKPTLAIKRLILAKLRVVDSEIIVEAIVRAGNKGKDWGYALGIINNWVNMGLTTGEALAHYEYERDFGVPAKNCLSQGIA